MSLSPILPFTPRRFGTVAALLLVTLGLPRLAAQSNAGSADDGFDPNPNGIVYTQVVQPDGHILIGGNFTQLTPVGATSPIDRSRLARINPDGSIDTTFVNPGLNGTVYALALQPDGKVIVGGNFTIAQPDGSAAVTRNRIVRLNADGTVDPTFDPNANASVNALAVQPDGRILIGGYFTALQPNGALTATPRGRLARVNADGTLDTAFDPNANQAILVLALQLDGDILAGGNFTTLQPNGAASPTTRNYVARLRPNGTIDQAFNPNPNARIRAIYVQPDGKVIIGGNFSTMQPGGAGDVINFAHCIRLNADGSVDTTFYPRVDGEVDDIDRQPDGKIVLSGNFSTLQPGRESSFNAPFLARINADGSTDRNFLPAPNSTVFTTTILDDGKIVFGGNFSQVRDHFVSSTVEIRNNFARINANGSIDKDFDFNSVGRITDMAVQSDGNILLVGNFTSIGGITRNYIARVFDDGTVDPSFAPVTDSIISAVVVQPDGKIVIGGAFSKVGGVSRPYLARLNADGSLDESYYPNPNAPVLGLGVQPDGKILVGGNFTRFRPNGDTVDDPIVHNFAARLNQDGTPDPTFDPNTNGPVQHFQVLANGQIMISGPFTGLNYNPDLGIDVPRSYIARISSTGAVDTSFEVDPSFYVDAFVVQSDGKLVIGGRFTGVREPLDLSFTTRNYIARFNADGTIDADYDPNANARVGVLAIQDDDKIIVGGGFTTIGGQRRINLARLNTDGTADTTFDPDPEGQIGTSINAIEVEDGGKVLFSGSFNHLQPSGGAIVDRVHLARFNADGTLDTGFDPSVTGQPGLQVNAIVQQPDGGVLVGGNFNNIGGANSNYLARFRVDGVADSSFRPDPDGPIRAISVRPGIEPQPSQIENFAVLNPNGSLYPGMDPLGTVRISGPLYSSAVQADGKILIGGTFTNFGTGGGSNLIRLNPDGTADPTFNPTPDHQVNVIKPLPDGHILIAGAFTAASGIGRTALALLNADGSVDQSFPNITSDSSILDLKTQADGKYVVVGNFNSLRSVSENTQVTRNRIARFSPDGTLDTAFNPGADGTVNTVVVQTDGKIVIGGTFANVKSNGANVLTARYLIARFNPDGTVDNSYDPNGNDFSQGGYIFSLAQESDGKIIVGGRFLTIGGVERRYLARLNTDGTLDTAFNPDPNDEVDWVAVQPDGKIVVGGKFNQIAGVSRNHLARLNPDGSVDFTFNSNIIGTVNSITLPGDGRIFIQGEFSTLQPGDAIMIGGAFANVGGVASSNFAVLNSDGTTSGVFQPNPDGPVNAILTQPDGKVLLGGSFANVGGGARSSLARINTDGSLDTGFSADVTGEVNSLSLQSDGSILVGGAFTSVGGVALTNLARINPDGTVDGAYAPNPDGTVDAVAIQADGSAVIGGAFANVGGAARNRIARLQSDGTADSFDPGADGDVRALSLRVDGQIVAGGDFTVIGGVARNRIAVLNADGSVDTGIDPSADGTVRALALQIDGQIVAGGNFSNIGGKQRSALARLATNATASRTMATDEDRTTVSWSQAGGSPELSSVSFEYALDGIRWVPIGSATRVGGSDTWQLTGLSLPDDRTFFVRALGRTSTSTFGSEGLIEQVWQFLPAPLISSAAAMDATEGEDFYYAVSTLNRATEYSATGLPAGLTINTATGLISGVPLQNGTFAITLRAVSPTGTSKLTLTLTIAATGTGTDPSGRMVALSTRGFVNQDSPLINGLVIGGSSAKTVLLRGVGPTLGTLGITNPLQLPVMRVINSNGDMVLESKGWSGDSELTDTFARLGDFPLPLGSADAAVLATLPPGAYTVQVLKGSSPADGTVLLEVYDASDNLDLGTPRLTAISTRGYVDSNSNAVVGGLAVAGTQPRQFIVRGVGPNLAKFGISNALANPILRIFDHNGVLLAQNDDWETPVTLNASYPAVSGAEIATDAATVGLAAYDSGSRDAAFVITLPPGVYTVDVTTVDNTAGIGLVEIYEMP